MKENVKKIGLLLGISLIFSFIIFKKYEAKKTNYVKYYILQVGAYKDYDNVMKNASNFENFIIHKEDDLYKLFIGITGSETVYSKLVNSYANNINAYKKEVKVSDETFIQNMKDYDKALMNTIDKNNMNMIVKIELELLSNLLEKNTEK